MMDFLDLKDLKLPHCIKCKCGSKAKFIGEDRGVAATKVALCKECYDLYVALRASLKNIKREKVMKKTNEIKATLFVTTEDGDVEEAKPVCDECGATEKILVMSGPSETIYRCHGCVKRKAKEIRRLSGPPRRSSKRIEIDTF